MSNIERELQKAVSNMQVPSSISAQVQQEIKKAASNIQVLLEKAGAGGSDSHSDERAADSNATGVQAEAPQQSPPQPKTALEKYCDINPSASECLIYEE